MNSGWKAQRCALNCTHSRPAPCLAALTFVASAGRGAALSSVRRVQRRARRERGDLCGPCAMNCAAFQRSRRGAAM